MKITPVIRISQYFHYSRRVIREQDFIAFSPRSIYDWSIGDHATAAFPRLHLPISEPREKE